MRGGARGRGVAWAERCGRAREWVGLCVKGMVVWVELREGRGDLWVGPYKSRERVCHSYWGVVAGGVTCDGRGCVWWAWSGSRVKWQRMGKGQGIWAATFSAVDEGFSHLSQQIRAWHLHLASSPMPEKGLEVSRVRAVPAPLCTRALGMEEQKDPEAQDAGRGTAIASQRPITPFSKTSCCGTTHPGLAVQALLFGWLCWALQGRALRLPIPGW